MKHAFLAVWALSLAAACSGGRPPVPVFDARVPLEPLLAKLKASGGDPSKIIHPQAAAELAHLENGRRYKFVVGPEGHMAIAPLPADAPANEYVHPVLAEGASVRTAGGVRVEHEGPSIRKVTVDQDSKAYCPTGGSLEAALVELVRLGVPSDLLRVENRPPACVGAEAGPGPAPRYGELMSEVGQRFERLGRAAKARRLELAAFELDELQEVFDEDLPKAEPPRESAGVNLAGVAQAFAQTNLPELKAALAAKDQAAFAGAYARAAETCNGCHKSSGHAFVEVPTKPGLAVPNLDPVR